MMLLMSRHKITILKDAFVLFTFLFQAGQVWLGKVGEVREMAADGATQVPKNSDVVLDTVVLRGIA